ncbi:hypothetical protein BDU57DRAFT_563721 [Ampelomyces quisqualis]|uniref:BTB domain-containing protein n=1 Tax=Ampelomyces quisqualis TaxID=50730 RepID=A0A6A5R1V3_AMPQU|nr:hypothetical protein BDU57DRAFT_563721 [Ampelomyces quisqualis]
MVSTTGAAAKGTRPRLSAPGLKFATVTVGNEHKRFVVHEDLLTNHSTFFRAALTGGFKESIDKAVHLEDQDSRIFELFVHWLYYQNFPAQKYNDDKDTIELYLGNVGVVKFEFRLDTLIRLYVFGDKYDAKALRHEAITEIFNRILNPFSTDEFPEAESIDYAFAHLDAETPLCRLLVDTTWSLDQLDFVDPDKIGSLSFMRSVWKRYKSGNSTGSIEKFDNKNVCHYHEHVDAAEREECSVRFKR